MLCIHIVYKLYTGEGRELDTHTEAVLYVLRLYIAHTAENKVV